MNTKTAEKINRAVCNMWLFAKGAILSISTEDVMIVRQATPAQIQTATEVIEAMQEDKTTWKDGMRHKRCVIDPAAIPTMKTFANLVIIEKK